EALEELLDEIRQFIQGMGPRTKTAGAPCRPGERSDLTNCRPRSGLGHAKPGAPGRGTQTHGAKPGTQSQGIVGAAGRAYASARGALTAAGKVLYDRLPRPVQAVVDAGTAAHHRAEGAFKDMQAFATQVARQTCRECSEDHIARVARV